MYDLRKGTGETHTTPKPKTLVIFLQATQVFLPDRDTLLQRALVVRHDDEPFLERRGGGCHASFYIQLRPEGSGS